MVYRGSSDTDFRREHERVGATCSDVCDRTVVLAFFDRARVSEDSPPLPWPSLRLVLPFARSVLSGPTCGSVRKASPSSASSASWPSPLAPSLLELPLLSTYS